MPSNHLILCRLLLSPSVFSSIRVFSNESALWIRWPKYWSFSFSISPSYEHPGLISFRMDWLDLLAVQRTLNSLLQHHSSKVMSLLFIFFPLIFISWRLITFNIVVVFATHWHESAMDLHVFPISIPPPASLSSPSLWLFSVHQPWALVSAF